MRPDDLRNIVHDAFGSGTELIATRPVGGGCINQCYRIQVTARGDFFLKINRSEYLDMFEAEAEGLTALAAHCSLKIPQKLQPGLFDQWSYLLMEFVNPGTMHKDYWEQLGQGLAKLHQVSSDCYGWYRDNYIGRLPQVNGNSESWPEFFINRRILAQIKLAESSGLLPVTVQSDLMNLCSKIDQLLSIEPPSLLHGDLWSGNVIRGPEGTACLVDPAVYYGHREIELAFTTLFGGFDASFYSSYNYHFPLEPGYQHRFDLYNLYPLLVHLNLFGQGYLSQITQILKRYK